MEFPLDAARDNWIFAMRPLPSSSLFPLSSDYAELVVDLQVPSHVIDRIFVMDVTSADLFDCFPLSKDSIFRLSNARGLALQNIWNILFHYQANEILLSHILRRARQLIWSTRTLSLFFYL